MITKNDSVLAEIQFEKGRPVGIWKKKSEFNKNAFDFLEFDSGRLVKEYSLYYQNGEITKRIEDDKEIIYENGQQIGTIVKINFGCRNGGSKLSVPNGKMWTPLYFEVSSSVYYIPRIYPQKSNYGGWLKSSSYPFPEKENFVSFKISKQNNRAIYGRDQAVLVDCYDNTSYTAFFLEESNN